MGLGLLRGLAGWRRYPSRALTAYLLFGLIVLARTPQKEIRFLYTIAPVIYVLAGLAVAWLVAQAGRHWARPRRRFWLAGGAAVLLVLDAVFVVRRFSYYNAALETAYLSPPAVRRAYQWIIEATLAQGVRPYVLNGWHTLNPYALEWEYFAMRGGDPAQYSYQLASGGLAPEPTPANLEALLARLDEMAPAALISIDGSPAGSYTGWHVVEPLLAQGKLETYPQDFHQAMEQWPASYWDAVLAGNLNSADELQQARQASLFVIDVTIHVYYLR
jgi:hypothetical protein